MTNRLQKRLDKWKLRFVKSNYKMRIAKKKSQLVEGHFRLVDDDAVVNRMYLIYSIKEILILVAKILAVSVPALSFLFNILLTYIEIIN